MERRKREVPILLVCCDRPTKTQMDPILEAFEKLRVREVVEKLDDSTASFLAKFQSSAASLEPNERIKLVVYAYDDMELLKAVFCDPQANKICALQWEYDGDEDVNSVIPLLINNCPELASLRVCFESYPAFDFVSSVLEHPSNKIKVLEMPPNIEGDSARFFAALGRSQVSALTLFGDESSEFVQGFSEYLARDLLVKLKVWMERKQVSSEMMMSLATCTRLAKLEMFYCEFPQPTLLAHLPKSVTELVLFDCTVVGGFDWSFLAGSNVRELDFHSVRGVDGNQFGDALAVHLGAKGLDRLHLFNCEFVDETLITVGVELGRIKRLILGRSRVSDAAVAQIALTLQSPNNEMKEFKLECNWDAASIENHLLPALKHPNCNLAELSFRAYGPEHKAAAERMEDMFYKRLALLALLQGQQVRRLYCPLRRLPVEMLRLVGKVLI
ncbi:hypothetical protein BASA81_001848 [Batrachochytrium salamandrivorans]|nr:hypothetical protein BASA81_001848 [Batrachochytrium salamandrivorans]